MNILNIDLIIKMNNNKINLEILLKNYQKNVKKIWDLRATGIYEKWQYETGDFVFIKAVLDSLLPETLLDIGFGYGRLAPVYKNVPLVIGMDVSQNMLELFLGKNTENKIPVILGDIRKTPFLDNIFDCVVSIRTLNHIHPDDFKSAEKEIFRISKRTVLLLESDIKVPDAEYEFEHDYDQFLNEEFIQTKVQLEKYIFLRTYTRKTYI
jgi:ubiquinone/menaquinone biosynthesis C-methylase UbiE